jgi:hypothetical protein
LGEGQLPRAGDAIARDCKRIIDYMSQPDAAQGLIQALEPALFKALDNEGLPGLGTVVKTDAFAARFRDAVLAQRQSDERRTDRLAA